MCLRAAGLYEGRMCKTAECKAAVDEYNGEVGEYAGEVGE